MLSDAGVWQIIHKRASKCLFYLYPLIPGESSVQGLFPQVILPLLGGYSWSCYSKDVAAVEVQGLWNIKFIDTTFPDISKQKTREENCFQFERLHESKNASLSIKILVSLLFYPF